MNVLKMKRLLVCSGVWFGLIYAAQAIQEVSYKLRLAWPPKKLWVPAGNSFYVSVSIISGGGIRYESVQCAVFITPFYL